MNLAKWNVEMLLLKREITLYMYNYTNYVQVKLMKLVSNTSLFQKEQNLWGSSKLGLNQISKYVLKS